MTLLIASLIKGLFSR